MLVLIILIVCFRLSALGTHMLQRHAPSNRAVRYLRTLGAARAIPASLALAAGYLLAAFACTALIERGGPGWLHLVVLLCIWNGMKLALCGAIAPLSLAVQGARRPCRQDVVP